MKDFITLPCGCRINETMVDAMCPGHHQQLHFQKAERAAEYSHYRRLMDLAALSPRRSAEGQ
jgi:hypothetical protein